MVATNRAKQQKQAEIKQRIRDDRNNRTKEIRQYQESIEARMRGDHKNSKGGNMR